MAEAPKPFPVPEDERIGLDDDEGFLPLERVAIVSRVALCVHRGACLCKESKLLPKQKVLCGERAVRAAQVASERDGVQNNRPDIGKQWHERTSPCS